MHKLDLNSIHFFSIRVIEYFLCSMSTEEIIYIKCREKKEEKIYVSEKEKFH